MGARSAIMTTDTTVRTISPVIQLRNIRNRIAVLTMRRAFGGLSAQESQELKDLQNKLSQLERQQS